MFATLEAAPADPILGLMVQFRADPSPHKVDLGVGIYKNERGETPVLDSVRQAERAQFEVQSTKSYVGPAGNEPFNRLMTELVLGAGHGALAAGRVRTVQAPGGCGALRLGAELVKVASPDAVVHVSAPTWANHVPLIGNAGFKLESYPYYVPARGELTFDAMLAALGKARRGDVVLLHACCHNPTGADLTRGQWQAVVEVVNRTGALPFLDLAYQGFGDGLEEDSYGIRLVAEHCAEAVIAVSCSKNFGVYRDRVGATILVAETPAAADVALSRVLRLARGIWSMPPDHGAAVVARVLGEPALAALWRGEVEAMRTRMVASRRKFADVLAAATGSGRYEFIAGQKGMFSMLGLSPEQVGRLRSERHIYMPNDSRINIAGLSDANIGYVAESVAAA